jgi:hypothetical protein
LVSFIGVLFRPVLSNLFFSVVDFVPEIDGGGESNADVDFFFLATEVEADSESSPPLSPRFDDVDQKHHQQSSEVGGGGGGGGTLIEKHAAVEPSYESAAPPQ